jgi:Flp pilus assembly protein TadD
MASPHRERDLHQRVHELHARGELAAATKLLEVAISEGESSDLWNDWGAVQASCGHADDAERAFRRALRMNRGCKEAAENLGVTLRRDERRSTAHEGYCCCCCCC